MPGLLGEGQFGVLVEPGDAAGLALAMQQVLAMPLPRWLAAGIPALIVAAAIGVAFRHTSGGRSLFRQWRTVAPAHASSWVRIPAR